MAGGPQGGKAVPVAGGQAVSEVACGVEEAELDLGERWSEAGDWGGQR